MGTFSQSETIYLNGTRFYSYYYSSGSVSMTNSDKLRQSGEQAAMIGIQIDDFKIDTYQEFHDFGVMDFFASLGGYLSLASTVMGFLLVEIAVIAAKKKRFLCLPFQKNKSPNEKDPLLSSELNTVKF